jgi:hypothetical protein
MPKSATLSPTHPVHSGISQSDLSKKSPLPPESIMGKKTVLFVFEETNPRHDPAHSHKCPVMSSLKSQLSDAEITHCTWTGFLNTVGSIRADLLLITGTNHLFSGFNQMVDRLAAFRNNNPDSVVTLASTQPALDTHVSRLLDIGVIDLAGGAYDSALAIESVRMLESRLGGLRLKLVQSHKNYARFKRN